jgi:hypothetical protein
VSGITSPEPRVPGLRALKFRAGGESFLAGHGQCLGERLDLPLGFRGPGGRRRGQRLGPQPGRLGPGDPAPAPRQLDY